MRNIESIVDDYLASRPLSEEEEKRLNAWKTTDRNNDLLALLTRMSSGAELNNLLKNRPESGLEVILNKLRKARQRRRIQFLSSAAAVVLLLGASFFYFFSGGLKYKTDYSPRIENSFRAEIILPNGNSISLDAQSEDTIRPYGKMAWLNEAHTVKINAGQPEKEISWSTFKVPLGGEYKIILPDGTHVFMNSGSELIFPDRFPENERSVTLNGEAYFDVVPDESKPFIVKANDLHINVLGTSFNVNSYSSMKTQAVTLESGLVKVICKNEEYRLDPGQQMRFNSITQRTEIKEVNTELYTSWKDGYYFFRELTLEEIMSSLSHWYGITVIFEDDWSRTREFSGRMKRYDDVEVLLDHFVKTQEITYRKEYNIVYIKRK